MKPTRSQILIILEPLWGLLIGIIAALAFTTVAGESPLHILKILLMSSFGSKYDFGMTLFYSTPLIFAGLSVAMSEQAGLFNIGAEGQLTLGVLAAAAAGVVLPNIPFPLAPLVALLAAVVAGGIWGFIPGWLKVKRGSHEVINTIMLNFVAAGLASWVALYLIPNPNSQNPETQPVAPQYLIKDFDPIAKYFTDTPVSLAFALAIVTALILWFVLEKTVWGFELRTIGKNEEAALSQGIAVDKMKITAMTIAGSLAGLVAASEVIGSMGQYKLGFSPGYGFLAIAVALLARSSPIGVIFTGLLFGALHKGTSSLDLETEHITRDFSAILQALIILCVSAPGLVWWKRKRKQH